jgi:prepilin-type N-terminal cleavage/methylation domain-containing protein
MQKRQGVSVIEVLVALVIFSIAALGGAASLGLAARAQRQAAATREAVGALQRQLGALGSTPCSSLASGSSLVGSVQVSWTVAVTDSLATIAASAVHRGTTTTMRTEVACS